MIRSHKVARVAEVAGIIVISSHKLHDGLFESLSRDSMPATQSLGLLENIFQIFTCGLLDRRSQKSATPATPTTPTTV